MLCNPSIPKLLYRHAANINEPPTAAFIPTCSPINATATAVPHNGSVEKINVVSDADKVSRAKVSIYIVNAVVIHPVQNNENNIDGSVNHSFHGKDVSIVANDDCKPARLVLSKTSNVYSPYINEEINTAINCAAVIRGASSGYRFIAFSILQNPSPNANGCTIDNKSPGVISLVSAEKPLTATPVSLTPAPAPPNSRKATPTKATIAPIH